MLSTCLRWSASARAHVHASFVRWCLHARSSIADQGVILVEYDGKKYLLVIDYYSKYLEMSKLEDGSADVVIQELKAIFARHGIPQEVVADNCRSTAPFSRDLDGTGTFK